MKTYLMSSDELRIIAAASGMDSFLMFEPGQHDDRGKEMQSILRLANDGFLIHDNASMKPGPSLIPFLHAFQHSSSAIVARLFSGEAAPVCIYADCIAGTFLRIVPHAFKEDFYEISIVDMTLLLDDAESSQFLPVLHEPHFLAETDISIGSVADTSDGQKEENSFPLLMTDGVLSTFEKYDLSTHTLLQTLSIFQTPFAWYMAIDSETGKRLTHYSRNEFATWLKGAP